MNANELMKALSPLPTRQVTLGNWRKPPFNKWSFNHVREIVPSTDIPNDPANVWELPRAPVTLDEIELDIASKKMTLVALLQATDTDAFIVLHRGKIVYDYYAPGINRDTPHILMSVSKSMLGLLVGILLDMGTLKLDNLVTAIIPEVKGTAYDGATLRDLLDMRVGVLFDENYLAASGSIIEYRKAQGWDPYGPGETPSDLHSFFRTLSDRDGVHNGVFHYVSPNTDLLGWVIERETGRRFADLVSELLWKPLGARTSAYITVDRLGAPRCAGGFCATVEDLARIGQLMVQQGQRGSSQIVPMSWIRDIASAGDPEAWDKGDFARYLPSMKIHYRSKWYTLEGITALTFGVGVFGQNVFVDAANEIVIAKLSSQALPMDGDRILLTMKAVEEIRNYLGISR
jgi:CubicO group peptidase (beta-lactamase class C family)